jgi:ketosteroid isomerase-like protein
MSEESTEVVRRLVDAWNRQDVEEILALTDPEAAYVNASNAVEPGTRRGHAELVAVVRSQWEALPGARWEIDRLHDRGSEVISVGRVSRAMPESDDRIDNPIVQSWGFRGGKVARIEMLGAGPDFREALAAAGL